jgi:hypothetical protein
MNDYDPNPVQDCLGLLALAALALFLYIVL